MRYFSKQSFPTKIYIYIYPDNILFLTTDVKFLLKTIFLFRIVFYEFKKIITPD